MAYDPEKTLQRARGYVRAFQPGLAPLADEQAECVALLAMALTLAINTSNDPNGAEELAIEAGSFAEQRLRPTQPEPEFTPHG